MRSYAFRFLALAASAVAAPQGVTSAVSPSAPAPAGCQPDYSGQFEITVVNVTSAAKVKRDALELTLAGGTLKDAQGRTGYIASNYQFQFDGPPQAGAIYTSGFSVCSNGTLALGGSAIWYQCYSGGFYNLYDRHWAAQCSPIYIEVIGATKATQAATQAADGQPGITTQVSQISDGQVQATTAAVTQIGDGQVQAGGVSQISDGQVQAGGVSQIADGQVQAPTGAPVGQISDGQIQATSGGAAPVGQISDGQVQATSAAVAPVSQIGDGQVQAPSGSPVGEKTDGQPTVGSPAAAPVTQISDGQVQAGTTAAPVTQISDGQVQAGTTAAPVTQISDGQVQAGSVTSQVVAAATPASSSAPLQQTVNAAPVFAAEMPAVAAGLAAAIALL